ncbi:hypothetical protein AA309_07330 [Microvirga vignae]|uniref:Uncharacterized protein n=1 Tax=Microvirga vignae TaxID=1225564 RepID=A0A0H1REM9_9HYPH|nr:hypothetical protein AA309_07330 [Microvirga vignae]
MRIAMDAVLIDVPSFVARAEAIFAVRHISRGRAPGEPGTQSEPQNPNLQTGFRQMGKTLMGKTLRHRSAPGDDGFQGDAPIYLKDKPVSLAI